jgi:hypothetical protein
MYSIILYFADGSTLRHCRDELDLKEIQQWAGGYIESITYFFCTNLETDQAYCDEEGILKDLPFNATLPTYRGTIVYIRKSK